MQYMETKGESVYSCMSSEQCSTVFTKPVIKYSGPVMKYDGAKPNTISNEY